MPLLNIPLFGMPSSVCNKDVIGLDMRYLMLYMRSASKEVCARGVDAAGDQEVADLQSSTA